MRNVPDLWPDPVTHLVRVRPDCPVLYFAPDILQATARAFLRDFPGRVSYAVKANDRAEVLANLVAAGLRVFDVASPAEMAQVRDVCPDAVLHYHNPVRSMDEIAAGHRFAVNSWSVDDPGELDKIGPVTPGTEIAVRFKLPVAGAVYDFGTKFGAHPDAAASLLRRVAATGGAPALTFHPGTQCTDPAAWSSYIAAAARIAQAAGVRLVRLNVGGGFPAHRGGAAPDLGAIFARIAQAVAEAFGPDAPPLDCEPGRAMVAEAFTLAARIKALRDGGGTVFLNDGIYGGLADLRDTGLMARHTVIGPDGASRTGPPRARIVFGPTCDSLDRLPDGMTLPADAAEGDHVLFAGVGAYSVALNTAFNGYGLNDVVTLRGATGQVSAQG